MEKILTLDEVDSIGHTGKNFTSLVGKRYKNNRCGKTYAVIGVTWLSNTDEWALLLIEVSPNSGTIVCTRSYVNFQGYNREGKPRFVLVP